MMWNLLKKIGISLGLKSDEDLTPKEEEEFIEALNSKEDDHSHILGDFHKTSGVITHINGSVAIIDSEHYFNLENSMSAFVINDHVDYTAFFCDNGTVIKNVKKIDNSAIEESTNQSSHENGIGEFEKNTLTLSGQIVNRYQRVLEVKINDKKDTTKINLDHVKSEFLPSVGDFVNLYVVQKNFENETNVGEVQVLKIKPYKTALKLGVVTSWNLDHGTISNFALFSSKSCETGFEPLIGQKVFAGLVRSDCENGYKWRAIQVIPHSNIISESTTPGYKKIEDEYRNKRGISISISPKVTLNLNAHIDLTIDVTNNSTSDKQMSVYCISRINNDQIELMYPNPNKIKIRAGETLEFPFRIHGTFVGSSHGEFIWDFGDFKIRRKISFEVLCDSIPDFKNDKISLKTSLKHISAQDLCEKSKGNVLPGRRQGSICPFVPVRIGEFSVPKNIYYAAMPDEKISYAELLLRIQKMFPCLREGLTDRNYHEYMHNLLYLEEIENVKRVAQMDIEAPFRKYLDYLILVVPEYSSYTKNFMPGDFVLASLPWGNGKKMQGIIHRITKTELWLKFAKCFHDSYIEGSYYFISFVSSRTSLRRMHQAVDIAMKHLGKKWLFPDGVNSRPLQITFEIIDEIADKNIENTYQKMQANNSINHEVTKDAVPLDNYNRNNRRHGKMWNTSAPGCGNNFNINEYNIPIKSRRFQKIKWYNNALNAQQKQAVFRVLMGEASPLPYIIFGPPGTGKTLTVVEAILQLHHLLPDSRILVATPTNSAADLIAERLIDSGNLQDGDFLRLVGMNFLEQGRLTASLIPYSAMPNIKDESNDSDGVQAFNREQISEHRIIVGTAGCLGILYNMGFPRGFFTHIIIDEAGQLTEPELMVLMAFLSLQNGNVILSGDPLQLGPVVMSQPAIEYGLKESFLFRLLSRFPYIEDMLGYPNSSGYDPRLVTKLIENYRSLDGILHLFSSLYYNGDLVAKVCNETSEEGIIFEKLKSLNINFPVLLHGVMGSSIQEPNSTSWYNPQEVFQVFIYLNKLYMAGLHPDQIGIITPYQLQSRKIQTMLEFNNMETPKVGSVEEFQGQEKTVIILSLVRCSEDIENLNNCDFVTDPRRMNVAISRARALLIIVGDPELMSRDVNWLRVLRYCKLNNSYIGCELPSSVNLS